MRLPCDDVRYFTVDVRPPSKVLLLGEKADDALFLREALAPTAAAGLAQSKFACEVGTFDRTRTNCRWRITRPSAWSIRRRCRTRRGSRWWISRTRAAAWACFLGRHARREEMNGAEAQQLLPAKLRWQSREATYLRPVAVEHPALRELRELADTVPWSEFPVFKYWELEAGAEPAHVVATFANGKPALVERQIGAGRVLMMTTSVSDPAHDDPWNLLPTGPDPWPFLALANGIARVPGRRRAKRSSIIWPGKRSCCRCRRKNRCRAMCCNCRIGSAVRQSLDAGPA